MGWRTKVAQARQIIADYNASLDDPKLKLDANKIVGQLQIYGANNDSLLSKMRWEDLERCGFPRLLAKEVALIFRKKPNIVETVLEETGSAIGSVIKNTVDTLQKCKNDASADLLDSVVQTTEKVVKNIEEAIVPAPKWTRNRECRCGMGLVETNINHQEQGYNLARQKSSCPCELYKRKEKEIKDLILGEILNALWLHNKEVPNKGNFMAPFKINNLETFGEDLRITLNDGSQWKLSLASLD